MYLLNCPFCGFLTKKSCGTIGFPVVTEVRLSAEASRRMFPFNQLNAAKPAMIPSTQWDPSHCCPRAMVLMLPFNVCFWWCSFQTGESKRKLCQVQEYQCDMGPCIFFCFTFPGLHKTMMLLYLFFGSEKGGLHPNTVRCKHPPVV